MTDQQAQETYTHGYRSAVRNQQTRTAEDQGAFFIRHLRTGMKILDCGCGPGTITVGLADVVNPGQVVGIDSGEDVIDQAKKLVEERTNLEFKVASVYEIPFPDGHFDGVLVHKVLEHVAEPETVMKEVTRVLKPGGVVGARSTDQGTRNIHPWSEAINDMFDNLQDRWQKNGGNPFFGRTQQSVMRKAGSERLETTHRAEIATADRWLQEFEKIWSGDYEEWVNRGFLTEAQASDPEEMTTVKSDLKAFVADPDWSFVTSLDYETVGWKPQA
ncbi:MAG: class I SAM-dependent methyltransferase [Chloroflexi bacterium]|nr:class I SAM-dependent methyltransferase [Chloroflexota bacterium]